MARLFKTGITAEGDISTSGKLNATSSAGDEGGEISLNKAATNTTLTTGVTIDVFQNRLRFWETGGTNRGYFLDISAGGTSVGTNIIGTATAVVNTVTGTNSAELVRGNMADNDQFRILVGGTATNTGFAEIATADDGTEPIHVRQYTGVFTTLVRTATLLDGSGNTSFPGTVTGTTFSGSGASLTSLPAGQLTGSIASARLPTATSTAVGAIELFSDTTQTVAANSVTTTAGRTYGIQLNAALQGVVNVPWTDTVYTAPTLAGTTLTSGGTITTLSGNLTTGGLTSTAAVSLNYASPTISSNNASAASIFTSTVTGVTIGSSTIRTTEFPADGTTSTATAGAGFMGLPQNATTTGAYTVVAADAGKHIYASATRTVTINSNTNLALPIGTTLTFIAGTGATMTIAITSDTLILAGPGTTGSRTLAPFGMATAVKITSTSWIISGNGLT